MGTPERGSRLAKKGGGSRSSKAARSDEMKMAETNAGKTNEGSGKTWQDIGDEEMTELANAVEAKEVEGNGKDLDEEMRNETQKRSGREKQEKEKQESVRNAKEREEAIEAVRNKAQERKRAREEREKAEKENESESESESGNEKGTESEMEEDENWDKEKPEEEREEEEEEEGEEEKETETKDGDYSDWFGARKEGEERGDYKQEKMKAINARREAYGFKTYEYPIRIDFSAQKGKRSFDLLEKHREFMEVLYASDPTLQIIGINKEVIMCIEEFPKSQASYKSYFKSEQRTFRGVTTIGVI